jgi:hypothetical protein
MRAVRGKRGRIALLLTLLAMVAAAAGSAAAGAASGRVGFHEVTAGSRGAIMPGERPHAVGLVLRSASQAKGALRDWGLDPAEVKSVDFSRKSLIVVLAEWQNSGGYRAHVSRVIVRGREAVVTTAVRYEGGELAVADLERPWVVVAVNRARVARVARDVRVKLVDG